MVVDWNLVICLLVIRDTLESFHRINLHIPCVAAVRVKYDAAMRTKDLIEICDSTGTLKEHFQSFQI